WRGEGYYKSLENRFNNGYEKKRPFIEASFDLQQVSGAIADYNCFLYALEFAKAAIQYLQNSDLSALHNACVKGDYTVAASLLHEGLKQYLPYFTKVNGTYAALTRDEILKYHRDIRWKISGLVMQDFLKNITNQSTVTV